MNNLRNSVQLIGYLGADPTVKELTTGARVAKVSIATSESYKNDKGEYIDYTTWHNLVGWDYVADRMMKLMKKGLEVVIQGKLVQRSYDDKNGIKRYVTEVKISNFILMAKEARKVGATAALDVAPEKEGVMPF